MRQPAYDKYNFILQVIGFIGSLGFYFGVLSGLSDKEPDKQLIEQLKEENRFLKQQIEQSTNSKAMISKRNYYRIMEKVNPKVLTAYLLEEAENVDLVTRDGENWEEYFYQYDYDGDKDFTNRIRIDKYFKRLHAHLLKHAPEALSQSKAAPKKQADAKMPTAKDERIALYFIREFCALPGTEQTQKRIVELLRDLQLAFVTEQITLETKFRPQIEEIQKHLIQMFWDFERAKRTEMKVALSPAEKAKLTGSIYAYRGVPSLEFKWSKGNAKDSVTLKALRTFLTLQGNVVTQTQVRNLRNQIDPWQWDKELRDNDPLYPDVMARLRDLKFFGEYTTGNKGLLRPSKMYLSWKDDNRKGKLGLGGISRKDKAELSYIQWVTEGLDNGLKRNRPETEKYAIQLGIKDKTKIKELTEYAIVESAREIALGTGNTKEKFDSIVQLYERQTNMSFRTSQSILLNQYSTPAPIGYLMGLYCGIDKGGRTFEPSAGNGMLTIASTPKRVWVNEIDSVRRDNLIRQPYADIHGIDAAGPITGYEETFDSVITNPPFGRVGTYQKLFIEGYRIYDLDHAMAIYALQTMKDSGRAAIIVGGHYDYDKLGRIKAGKDRIFFNFLYSRFYVEDVIPMNGRRLYARQGTSFGTTLILINGRKAEPQGVAPLRTDATAKVVTSFDELYERVMAKRSTSTGDKLEKLRELARSVQAQLTPGTTLEGPYTPSSKGHALDTQVPDSMDFEMHEALTRITEDVGGDMDNFVRHRLGYPTKQHLYDCLAAEQIDVVGMTIYNIEALNQALIVGDQTGIGKGRVAAAMIRYASLQGVKPIFLTVGVNLFSDIYRDLEAIGSAHLKPFIVNAKESKTDIKDEDGLVIYQAPTSIEQHRVFETGDLTGYDFVMATYSQFNSSADKKPNESVEKYEKREKKPRFLAQVASDTILIMDESHVASGSSNTGKFMQGVVKKTRGACFLSATFAKRSDNMPIYALKTAISEANMSRDNLVWAIEKGGVALQEILAAQLVSEGQMVRRERSYEGIEVNYITLDDQAAEHTAVSDNITAILRDIISFQSYYVDKRISEMDILLAGEGLETNKRGGTDMAGVDSVPYFSKVFNVINQMLFSIKAEAVADRAIMRLKEGKKPVIAFSSTMGSFLEQIEDVNGNPAAIGDTVKTDFAIVLDKGLEGVMRYTVTAPDGSKDFRLFDLEELGPEAEIEYNRIREEIRTISTGISISPIDVIIERIVEAGYSVGEVTGRKLKLSISGNKGVIQPRKRMNTNDAFRRFNNNELDVLLINQSGSTGASAHAIPTPKVPASEVKPRVMIVLQPELDINIEIQKRGRINRTGQIYKPVFDYMNSAIPAEKRLMMMLQKKLKSLDANTSSNQKQSSSILDVPDFLNKYGDGVVVNYLKENPELNKLLGDPVKISATAEESSDGDTIQKEDAALKTSGRVAVLSAKMQEDFYNDIRERYDNLVAYLKQTGDYDLEVEEMDLKAKVLNSKVLKMGRGGYTSFGEDSFLETVEANVLRKPFKPDELKNIIQQALEGKTPEQVRDEMLEEFEDFSQKVYLNEIEEIDEYYKRLRTDVANEPKIKKIKAQHPELVQDAIYKRLEELDFLANKETLDAGKVIQHRKQQIGGFFKYFTIGKRLLYPEVTYNGEIVKYMAVFIGFKVDAKQKNPYAPSAIGLRFAIASSQKNIEIPASYGIQVDAIKGASVDVEDKGIDHTLYEWHDAIQSNSKDRSTRYIITGNILQAFAQYKGKLVSYSTIDGGTKKGILLPEYMDIANYIGDQVDVPISKTLKLFKSLVTGKQINASHGITFFKVADGMYQMIVNGSMREGGEVFLNLKVIDLTFNGNFERIGKNMRTHVEASDLAEMLRVLEDDIGVSVKMSEQEIDNVGLIDRPIKPRVKITPPPQEDSKADKLKMLRIRAMAVEVELQLRARKNKAS